MPALVSFASVLRRSRYRLDISNPVSLLRRILCLRQPPKLIVKDHANRIILPQNVPAVKGISSESCI